MLKVALQRLLVFRHRHPINPGTGCAPLPPECPFERGDVDVMQQCREPCSTRSSGRLIHTPEVRQQGLPAQCPALRLFRRDPVLPLPFSITSFPSVTSSILWSGPTPIRDAANCGCPSFVAPIGDQPMDADGPHRFRNGPFGRDVVQAPGGASDLSHSETRCAAFAGAGASSASATCPFRESISHPVRPLSTLRTPRCRDARKTRSRPACSALDGPDLHWQAHIGFSYRTPHPALGQDFTPSPTTGRGPAVSGVRAGSARKGARVDSSRPCVA